tara:strand:+ start:2367 stop:3203 length:837 start_codon:yes stop_codon:yes gene_type:complete
MVDKKINIGIVGFGFVGNAVNLLEAVATPHIYDVANPTYSHTDYRHKAYNSDIIFLNVPTNLGHFPRNDRLNTNIVEKCIQTLFKENSNWRQATVVIKSTLPVGFCDETSDKYGMDNIVYNPEFLTQRTALSDFRNQREIYLAGNPAHTAIVRNIYELFFTKCKNKKAQFFETEKHTEFELLKLARNSFYGVKVSYCNQLYNLCKKINIDYDSFREHFTRGDWIEEQHTYVPGPDGELGFGGKCLPKDAIGLHGCFKEHGIDFKMLKTSLEFNKAQRD